MNKDQIKKFQEKLEGERRELEGELETIGRRNPENPDDWEATPDKQQDILKSDDNEVGDMFEEYEGNTAILKQLEIRYNDVKNALAKIAAGDNVIGGKKYGLCEVCGKEIEIARMEANPAATTCIEHMK